MVTLPDQIKKEQQKAKRESLESKFYLQLMAFKLTNGCEKEFLFHPTRKWRVDFAWPAIKLLVEIEGGTKYGNSRHSKGFGFDADAEKYNTASAMGFVLFRFSGEMIKSGEAISFLEKYLKLKA